MIEIIDILNMMERTLYEGVRMKSKKSTLVGGCQI